MKIANIIVDVSAYPIDRPFDYVIPTPLEAIVVPGVRVKVPFGSRPVIGYVIGLSEKTDVTLSKLKAIVEVIDVVPVLTQELLQLAQWLAKDTLSLQVEALKMILPSAMRGKYEKFLYSTGKPIQDPSIAQLFEQRQKIPLKEVILDELLFQAIQKAEKNEELFIETVVGQKTAIKKMKMIQIASKDAIQQAKKQISTKAHKQLATVEKLIDVANEQYPQSIFKEQFDVSTTIVRALEKVGVLQLVETEIYRAPLVGKFAPHLAPKQLTEEQKIACEAIVTAVQQQKPETFLLHGITGSGKTEVYLQAIEQVLTQGKEAIVLVPEIALTPQMVARFKERFGDLVAVMHSGLSDGEKYDEWRKVHRQEVQVVVGARSAVYAPFTNIGLIILDEEHEATYKQDESPRYHARDVALWRASYQKCPVVLGSATPSLESYARATKGVYHLLKLTKRAVNDRLPAVTVIDMREELRTGNRSMFSTHLMESLQERLEKKEQSILLLNRRGFSSFVMCRDCGTTVECPHCDISLTYHRSSERLKCHYCGYEEYVPKTCPQCASEHIRFFGTGTQKVEVQLKEQLPNARILRMDVDTTRKKGSHEKILQQFERGEADILLGTQMIAKGLDFPSITLVGVLAADAALHIADFRAAEKTYQLLTQVSGRAGRHQLPGEVVVQTYTPEHYAIQLAKQQVYEPFYEKEMAERRMKGHPPFYYLTVIQVAHEELLQAAQYAERVASYLRETVSSTTIIMGPATAPISRLNNRYRYQCLIKYKQDTQLLAVLHQIMKFYRTEWEKEGVVLTIDRNPQSIY